MSSISTSSFYGRKKLESSHFKQKSTIVDFNFSDKEEDNEDIRDEIYDIVEGFNKKSDDEWSESNDTDFLDVNNSSSSDTESDESIESTTQNPIVNSQNNFRRRKKQPCSFDTSFKGEYFPPPSLDPLSPCQYFKIFFDDNLIKHIREQTNFDKRYYWWNEPVS